MINNEVIRNCTIPFPAVEGLVNDNVLGKILIKNLYQSWKGENIKQIKQKHEHNPYSLRIGMPSTDSQMQNDSMYFILHYLAYNPLTKNIEKRELVPYRNTEKIYVGQSIDEKFYKEYKMFVDGNIVADDLYLKQTETLRETSLNTILTRLLGLVEKLQIEVAQLKRESKNNTIYSK